MVLETKEGDFRREGLATGNVTQMTYKIKAGRYSLTLTSKMLLVTFAKAILWRRGARRHITVDWSLKGRRGRYYAMNRLLFVDYYTLDCYTCLSLRKRGDGTVVRKWYMGKVSIFCGFALGFFFFYQGEALVLKTREWVQGKEGKVRSKRGWWIWMWSVKKYEGTRSRELLEGYFSLWGKWVPCILILTGRNEERSLTNMSVVSQQEKILFLLFLISYSWTSNKTDTRPD